MITTDIKSNATSSFIRIGSLGHSWAKPYGKNLSMEERMLRPKLPAKTNVKRSFASYLQEAFSGEVVRSKSVYTNSVTPSMRETINKLIV